MCQRVGIQMQVWVPLEALDPLELELQMFVRLNLGTGNWTLGPREQQVFLTAELYL